MNDEYLERRFDMITPKTIQVEIIQIDDAGSDVTEPWIVPPIWAHHFRECQVSDEIEIPHFPWMDFHGTAPDFPETNGIVRRRHFWAFSGPSSQLGVTLYVEWT